MRNFPSLADFPPEADLPLVRRCQKVPSALTVAFTTVASLTHSFPRTRLKAEKFNLISFNIILAV